MAVPWLWFAVRDRSALLDVIAGLWPAIGVATVVLLLVAAMWRRSGRLLAAAASMTLVSLLVVLGPWSPHRFDVPISPLRVVVANLAHSQLPSVADSLLAQQPDLAILLEYGPADAEREWTTFPHQKQLPGRRGAQTPFVLVQSRYPILESQLLPRFRAIRLVIAAPSGNVVVYATHFLKPGFPSQRARDTGLDGIGFRTRSRLANEFVALTEQEALPTIVAGDLNTHDRSVDYRRFTRHLNDAMREHWPSPTSKRFLPLWRFLLLRIDHVLVTDGLCAADSETFVIPGSDHRGIAVDVGLCPVK